jgi:hypothetical protein
LSTYSAKKTPPKQPVYNFTEPTGKKILAFSGKIGAGKSSCCNFIFALLFVHLLRDSQGNPFAPYGAFVGEDGKLKIFDENSEAHFVELKPHTAAALSWLSSEVWPFARLVSFADPLKEFCINLLGLKRELVYGSQEDKNQPSGLVWENLPYRVEGKNGEMTVREVLEEVGTKFIRNINTNGHVNALINLINSVSTHFFLIDDVRFINECDAIHSLGGHVIRLTRLTEDGKHNVHKSNLELDNYAGFDAVIDNDNMTIEEMFSKIMEEMIRLGYVEAVG